MRIDGRKIGQEILDELRSRPAPKKFFAALLAGEDPASVNFLKQKERVARTLGVDFRLYRYPGDAATDTLRREIGRLAGAKNCGGFIVQIPLPGRVNRRYVLNAIPKEKDADMMSEKAFAEFARGSSAIDPPPVAVVKEILKRTGRDIRSVRTFVLGAGFLIGKPVRAWLERERAEFEQVDEYSGDFGESLRRAEVVISGAGSPHFFGAQDVKNEALVIDFGTGSSGGGLVGDFNPSHDLTSKNVSYTPTPGGTGPILVAKLFGNFYALNS